MHVFDSPRTIFVKASESSYTRFKADRVDNHVEGVTTFYLESEIVAQVTRANIEFWRVIEEEDD